ncbi:MAG TPA: hypothetical protein VF137_07220 [Candidatus Dormibacteraeota bacterium]
MRRQGRVRGLLRLAKLAAALVAISQEMAKPESERTWHGEVFGFVPYDFRPPTWDRLRESYWNPTDERLLLPRPLGVGWAVNFYQARTLMMRLFDRLMGSGRPSLTLRQRGDRTA